MKGALCLIKGKGGENLQELNQFKLGYLHIMDGLSFGFHQQREPYTLKDVRKKYRGIFHGQLWLHGRKLCRVTTEGDTDLIAFGRPFITNPDLPLRIKNG
jgi:N-ethylmaleimide reductase